MAVDLEKIGQLVKSLTTEKSFKELVQVYKTINSRRKDLDYQSKKCKAIEANLETLMSNKLIQEDLESVKTDIGIIANRESTTVSVEDAIAFRDWLAEDFEERKHLLMDKPYDTSKIKNEFPDDLPPGLKWFSQLKLSITKR